MDSSCRFTLRRLLASAALLSAAGCGGAYDSSVSGEVSLDGNPVQTGAVAFMPESGGPTAYAQIDSAGRYDVYTGKEVGLTAGSYGVTVVSRERPAMEYSKLGGPPPPGRMLTPPWYAVAQFSPLKFQVKPGKNEINLELNSTPPPAWKPPRGRR